MLKRAIRPVAKQVADLKECGGSLMRKKDKQNSGYRTPKPTISIKELIAHDLFINPEYDDWWDHRDGMRDWFGDNKLIKQIIKDNDRWDALIKKRKAMNKKQKLFLKRRKAKKEKFA
ncbi:MAG: hypothetical protein KKF65_03280 [Nanoarchaeota archaeon]|nr:hypothetical protein [Nanoarchaeota archaeon]